MNTLYLSYMKSILGVRKSTQSSFVYKELDILPLIKIRHIKIFKYWIKIMNLPQNSLVRILYKSQLKDIHSNPMSVNWAFSVEKQA